MKISYKEILKIVLPLIISGFGQSIIYVTDTLFLGRLGEVALGASAIAGLFYASMMMVGFGISSGLQVIIAQKFGEGKREETGNYLFNGIFIQVLVALSIMLFYFTFKFHLTDILIRNEEIKNATEKFLDIRVWGFVPYFLFYAYRAFYLGIGETKIISVVIVVMSVLNLGLNPLLIYGYKDVVESYGYAGSAMASVVSECVSVFLIMGYYAYKRKSYKFFSFLKKEKCAEIITLSLPLIFQHFISVFSWFLFFVFIEKMGAKELAVSNIVRAVYVLVMSPILAFSHSTVTIIGQLFGAKEYKQLQPSLQKIVLLSALFTLPFSVLCFFEPQWLMYIFTNDDNLIGYGDSVMKVVAWALMYFAIAMPWMSAVTGIGKTVQAFMIESVSFVIYILASYLFVFVWKLDLVKVWLNEFVYFSCIMGLSVWVFTRVVKEKLKHEKVR